MKKFILFLGFIFLYSSSFSQSQRYVLLEEFTSSTCGPCATANPGIMQKLQQNPDKFTAIFYHVGWPAPGNDPMYLANTAENNARVGYYNFNTVPRSYIDGNYYVGNPSGWTMNTINARYAMPSPFELHLRHQISAANDSVYLTMLAKCTQAVSGQLVAHNVVIEKLIHFNTPPGTNGERDFNNVMKKMLPNSSGTAIPTPMVNGDYVLIETSWAFAGVYDVAQIAAIGFIQSNGNKEIHQTANSSTDAFAMAYNNDLQVMTVSDYFPANCEGKVRPVVKIRNNGNNAVTSFTVNYKVNDGTYSSYTWNGNLPTLGKTFITLPEYTFTPQASNTLEIASVNPNNNADEYPKNDTMRVIFTGGKSTSNILYFSIKTDEKPQETSYSIIHTNTGEIIKQSAPYTQALTIYKDTIELPYEGCYSFVINDTGGDGICCEHGQGSYQLKDSEGSNPVILQGSHFGYSEGTQFKLDPTGIVPIENPGNLSLYPNPFSGNTTVDFRIKITGSTEISLINPMGQIIKRIDLGVVTAGNHRVELDGSDLKPGIYILRLKTGSEVYTRKAVITQ